MAKKTKKIKSQEDYKDITVEAVEQFNKKDFKAALDKFLEMEQSNPENPKVHEILVYIYLNLQDPVNAEKQYKLYINLLKKENPSFKLPATRTFDELVDEAGDLAELENRYNELMSQESIPNLYHDLDVAAKLSVLYMSKGEFKKAEEVLLCFKKKCKAA
ncbi:MAG: hypothetical protein A2Y33_10105 [Spirochaetes bacterium GWF1_51_8]|nr:MAG: hypothetical protein A2Y33_10105 [Spirochaetes bacterium GWF1_51_8]